MVISLWVWRRVRVPVGSRTRKSLEAREMRQCAGRSMVVEFKIAPPQR